MELLAPAGSPEALRAAVQNGADAVWRRNTSRFISLTSRWAFPASST